MTGKVILYRGDLAVTTMAQASFVIYRLKNYTYRDTSSCKVLLLYMMSPEVDYSTLIILQRLQNQVQNKRNNLSFFVDPFTRDTILT